MKRDLKKGDVGKFQIIEHGNKIYTMKYELFKSRLNIYDTEGNCISIDKRKGRIVIDRHSTNVGWHRE